MNCLYITWHDAVLWSLDLFISISLSSIIFTWQFRHSAFSIFIFLDIMQLLGHIIPSCTSSTLCRSHIPHFNFNSIAMKGNEEMLITIHFLSASSFFSLILDVQLLFQVSFMWLLLTRVVRSPFTYFFQLFFSLPHCLENDQSDSTINKKQIHMQV